MDASGNYGKISNLYHLFHSVDDSAAPEKSAEAPHEAPPDESPTDQVSVRQPSYLLAIQQSIAERLESVVRAMDEENPKKPEEKPQEPSAGGGRTPKAPVEAPPKPAPPPPQAEQKPAAAPAAAQGKPDDGGRAPGAAAPDQNLQNAQLRAAAETGDTLKQFARPQAARADEQAADLRAQDAKLATPGKDQAPAAEAKPGATPQSGIADAKAAGGDAKAAGVEVKAAGTGRGAVADAKAPARPATETKEAAKPSRFAALVETATKTAGSVIGRVVGGVTGAKVGETVGSTFGKTLGRGVDYVKGKISDIMRSRPAIRLQRAMQGTIKAQDNLTDIITGRKEEKSLLEKLREPEWNASDLASRLAPDDPDLATWLEQRLEHIMAQKLPKGERHQAIRKLIHELRAEKATRASGDAAADKKAGPGGSAVEKVAQKDNAARAAEQKSEAAKSAERQKTDASREAEQQRFVGGKPAQTVAQPQTQPGGQQPAQAQPRAQADAQAQTHARGQQPAQPQPRAQADAPAQRQAPEPAQTRPQPQAQPQTREDHGPLEEPARPAPPPAEKTKAPETRSAPPPEVRAAETRRAAEAQQQTEARRATEERLPEARKEAAAEPAEPVRATPEPATLASPMPGLASARPTASYHLTMSRPQGETSATSKSTETPTAEAPAPITGGTPRAPMAPLTARPAPGAGKAHGDRPHSTSASPQETAPKPGSARHGAQQQARAQEMKTIALDTSRPVVLEHLSVLGGEEIVGQSRKGANEGTARVHHDRDAVAARETHVAGAPPPQNAPRGAAGPSAARNRGPAGGSIEEIRSLSGLIGGGGNLNEAYAAHKDEKFPGLLSTPTPAVPPQQAGEARADQRSERQQKPQEPTVLGNFPRGRGPVQSQAFEASPAAPPGEKPVVLRPSSQGGGPVAPAQEDTASFQPSIPPTPVAVPPAPAPKPTWRSMTAPAATGNEAPPPLDPLRTTSDAGRPSTRTQADVPPQQAPTRSRTLPSEPIQMSGGQEAPPAPKRPLDTPAPPRPQPEGPLGPKRVVDTPASPKPQPEGPIGPRSVVNDPAPPKPQPEGPIGPRRVVDDPAPPKPQPEGPIGPRRVVDDPASPKPQPEGPIGSRRVADDPAPPKPQPEGPIGSRRVADDPAPPKPQPERPLGPRRVVDDPAPPKPQPEGPIGPRRVVDPVPPEPRPVGPIGPRRTPEPSPRPGPRSQEPSVGGGDRSTSGGSGGSSGGMTASGTSEPDRPSKTQRGRGPQDGPGTRSTEHHSAPEPSRAPAFTLPGVVIAAQAAALNAPTTAAAQAPRGEVRGTATGAVKAVDGVGVSSGGAVGSRPAPPGRETFQPPRQNAPKESESPAATETAARKGPASDPQGRTRGTPGGPPPDDRPRVGVRVRRDDAVPTPTNARTDAAGPRKETPTPTNPRTGPTTSARSEGATPTPRSEAATTNARAGNLRETAVEAPRPGPARPITQNPLRPQAAAEAATRAQAPAEPTVPGKPPEPRGPAGPAVEDARPAPRQARTTSTVSDTAARTSEATTNDGAAAKQEFIGQMRPAQRLVHGPAGPAQQRTAPPAQSKTSTPTESTVVDETSRFQAREQQQTAQRGTLQATRNAASSNAELDKGPQRSSLSGAPTVTDRPQQRIVEKSGGRDQSGSGTGEDQQDPQRQTTTRVDARVEAVQQQQVENAQRVRTQVGEAGHRRVMAEQMMLKRLESLNPERQTQTAAKHASSVIGVILKKAYGDEKMRQKDAAKFVALVLRSHGFYTYEHCTRLIDLSTSLADMVGRKDEETKERLAAGVMFKDLGEVEYLISKGTPRQRQVLEQFLAGEGLAHQGLLHDIGKIKIPKEILYKPGMLTPEEARIMQMHPVYGAEILQSIPPLAHAAPAAKHHHERYDGKGYPDRLKGDTIPFEARVIAVVDTFDAMVADRPYRKGLPLEVCRSELVKGKFKQFDPDLVDAFMEVLDEKFVRGKLSMEDYKLGPGA